MILLSATSGRTYALMVRNSGVVFLSRALVPLSDVTPFGERCLVTEARTKAFSFEVTDTDLNNPLVILRTQEVLKGRAYALLTSPNGREWEVTCPQDGLYRVRALSTDWPKAGAPILTDPATVPWRFEVQDGGVYQVTSDPAETVRRQARLKTQDGTQAFVVSVDTAGMLTVTDLPSAADALFYEAELLSPTGQRWLLQVDNAGVLLVDSTWQDSLDQGDEWPLLIADRQGTLYCVDARFPPPIGGARGSGRPALRRPW